MSNMVAFYRRSGALCAAICVTSMLLFVLWTRSSESFLQDQDDIRHRLARAFPYDMKQKLPNVIWQTWKRSPSHSDFEPEYREAWETWSTLNSDFQHEVVTDAAASQLVATLFAKVPEVSLAYEALPKAVLKADFFRYLILLSRGGVYSDIDTSNLKPINEWVPEHMEPYGLVVGIEADPDRPDWNDWYARRIQFCQWTIASKPGHPVLANIVASITEETLWRQSRNELDAEHMKSVMEFTGPGIWTDVVFEHLNRPSRHRAIRSESMTWEDFVELEQRRKVDDVIVLPITSFSPDVGHMGSKSSGDPLAFVKHAFSGSWKPKNGRRE